MTLVTAKVPSFPWDVESYGKNIDIKNIENLTEPIINGYISWFMEEYKRRQFRDEALWEAFGEDFEGWTK